MVSAFTNPFSSFFFAGDDKNVPQALRQKIALAMLMQKRAAPRTFGEGLTALGEGIADRRAIMSIEKEAAAAEAAGQKARDEFTGGAVPPIAASSYASTDSVQPGAPQSPVVATMQQQHPDLLQNQKQPLVTTPPAQQPPSGLFTPPAQTPPPMGGQPPPPGMLVDPAQANSIDNAGLADRTFARQRGIAGIESGGAKDPYSLLGSTTRTGDRAYGKYQVMGANVPSWTQAALGQSMTPQQFLANPQAQDAVFNHRFGQYADKYGEQGAAKAWYAGERGMQNPNATDMHGRLTVADYGNDYTRRVGAPDPRGAAASALMAQQQPPAGLPPEITGGASQPDQRLAFNGAQPPAPSPQIRTAPPPQPPQPRPAPPQAGPEAGYVPTLGPAPTPPPTQTEGMVKIQNIIRNTPPSQRDSVIEALKEPYAQEQAKLAQQNVIYQDMLKRHHEREKQREDALISQRQRVDAAREAEQRIKKGDIPEVKQDIETGLTYNSNTGQWEQPKIAGNDPDRKPPFKGTEFQGKALVNYGRAKIAQEGLTTPDKDGITPEQRLASSPVQSALSSAPVVGSLTRPLRSDAFKEADTHADNFVQAFIRQQSGGAYGREELEQEARGMLPKLGDTPKQIESKREQREQFLNGLYGVVGTSGQKGLEIDARKREEERAARAAEKEMKDKPDPLDKREILMPDGTIKVRRDGKWVPK